MGTQWGACFSRGIEAMQYRSFRIRSEGLEDVGQNLEVCVTIDTACERTRKAIIDSVGVYDSKLANSPDFEAILEKYCQIIGERLVYISIFRDTGIYDAKRQLDREEGFFEVFSKEDIRIEFGPVEAAALDFPAILVKEVKT